MKDLGETHEIRDESMPKQGVVRDGVRADMGMGTYSSSLSVILCR